MSENDNKSTPKAAGNVTASSKSTTTDKKLSSSDIAKIAANAKKESQTKAADKPSTTAKSTKSSASKPVSKAPASKTISNNGKQKISKVGLLALLIALISAGGVGGHYWWQLQQDTALETRLTTEASTKVAELDQHLQVQISKLQDQSQKQINDLIQQVEKRSGSRIAKLEAQLQAVIDSRPNNWQVTEAEYLTRMAGRVLWLEKDIDTAVSLMEDADTRIRSLKDPRMLAIRQLINKDIERLKVLPKLQRQDIILSLMGLAEQVKTLELATVTLPEQVELTESTALSDDISDWQQNLSKSWAQFKDQFITIRRRNGNVDPLMEPKFEQNLFHNLSLKFQQAQWAISKGHTELYQQTILDIQTWLSTYFDMTKPATQKFNARLSEIKNLPINVDYPQELESQQALQKVLDKKPSSTKGNKAAEPNANQDAVKPKAVTNPNKETAEVTEEGEIL